MGFSLGDIKKFLHSDTAAHMARQALGIPADGEETPDTPPPVNVPSPTRTVTTTQQPAIAAPLPTTVPPPTRVTMDTPPPPGPDPGYINNMERVYQNLPQPNLTNATVDAQGNTAGAQYNIDKAPMIPAPVRTAPAAASIPVPMTAPMPVSAIPAPHRVFMGERTGPVDDSGNVRAALSPAEDAAAHLRALQADPSQSVTKTPEGYEVGAPHKISRLKAMGKMFLARMMAGSQYGVGGMLGAGAVGAIEGGVNPGHAQKVFREAERARAQGEQQDAQTLERGQLGNEAAKLNIQQDQQALIEAPRRRAQQDKALADQEYEHERTNFEQGVSQLDKVAADDPKRPAYEAALQTEADRLSQKYGRKVTLIPGEGRQPTRFSVDGQVVEIDSKGQPKVLFGTPKTDNTDTNYNQAEDYKYREKVGEITAKRAASEQAAAAAESLAADYQNKVNGASAQLSALDAQMKNMPAQIPDPSGRLQKDNVTPAMVANPALGPLKRQRADADRLQREAQKGMEDAYRKRDEHKSKAAEFVVPPPPPVRGKKAATGHVLPRANLAEAAKRLVKQGKIKDASQAEAYLTGQGVTVQ